MKLREYLEQNDISQSAFAREMDVSREAVRQWLKGIAVPPQGNMRQIIAYTNGAVQPNDFYETTIS